MSSAPDRQPPIALLVLGLVIAAGSVALFRLSDLASLGSSTWWMILLAIVGFVLADATVVEVHSRSETLAFTFIELPLFVAALFISPTFAFVAMVVGVAISVLVVQRAPLLKGAFNIANAALQAAMGLWIFHALLDGANPLGPQGWGAATIAAMVSSAMSAAALVLVLFLVQGRNALRGMHVTFFMGAVTSVTNVSLALIGASLLDYRPIAVVLLVIPTAVLYGAYWAFTSEQAQRERMQGMHELALEVRSIRDQEGIFAVLTLAAEQLDATNVELVLFPDHRGGGQATKFVLKGGVAASAPIVSSELATALDTAHALQVPTMERASDTGPRQIAGAIRGEARALGLLCFQGRLRDDEFSDDDLAMFETIVEQLGLTIENNQLGQAVTRLERRGQQLQHEVNHDGLTGLANRSFLAAKLEAELEANRNPSLLYLDLDDFKDVNDIHGHDAGDQVLRIISQRFESVVGATDCVARIGGDEFAVLLGEYSDDIGVATALLKVATEQIQIGDATVHVNASIGIARAREGIDGPTLLKRADVAMYNAKEQGKGTLAFSSR